MLGSALKHNQFEDTTEVERQFQGVDLSVFGRYMLTNKQEFPCQISHMSAGTAAVVGPGNGEIGETVIAYMDHVGPVGRQDLASLPRWLCYEHKRHATQKR